MRASLLTTLCRVLTWFCVILLAFLLLLPAEEMQEIVPIDIPGLLEHFIAYAGSAAIAMAATAGEKAACGSLAIFGYTPAFWNISSVFRPAGTHRLPISWHPPLERCAAEPQLPSS